MPTRAEPCLASTWTQFWIHSMVAIHIGYGSFRHHHFAQFFDWQSEQTKRNHLIVGVDTCHVEPWPDPHAKILYFEASNLAPATSSYHLEGHSWEVIVQKDNRQAVTQSCSCQSNLKVFLFLDDLLRFIILWYFVFISHSALRFFKC